MRTMNRARAALLIGSAFAAPMAVVGVANAVTNDGATPTPSPKAGATDTPTADARPSDADIASAQAFWDGGYQFCDATAIAAAHGTDEWEAKVSTGAALLAGTEVAAPSGCTDADVADAGSTAVDAFFDNGYQFCDAVALAGQFGGDPYETKIAVGTAIVNGGDVPAPTGCTD
jgi:hypothetical protein